MSTLLFLTISAAVASAARHGLREPKPPWRSPEVPNPEFEAKRRQLSMHEDCTADNPQYIGDGFCDRIYNIPECGFDGGDCCESTCYLNLMDGSPNGCLTEFHCIDPMVLDPHKSRTSGGTTNALHSLRLDPHRGWTSEEETSARGEWKKSTASQRDHTLHSPALDPHRGWANEEETSTGGVYTVSFKNPANDGPEIRSVDPTQNRTNGEEPSAGEVMQKSAPRVPSADLRKSRPNGAEKDAGGDMQTLAVSEGVNEIPLDEGSEGKKQREISHLLIGSAIAGAFVISVVFLFLIQRSEQKRMQSSSDLDVSEMHRGRLDLTALGISSLSLHDDSKPHKSRPKPVSRARSGLLAQLEKPKLVSRISSGSNFEHLEKPKLVSRVSSGSKYSEAMSLVVDDPELWKEFQDRLKASKGTSGSGNVNTRELLREFVREKGLEPMEETRGPMAMLRSVSDTVMSASSRSLGSIAGVKPTKLVRGSSDQSQTSVASEQNLAECFKTEPLTLKRGASLGLMAKIAARIEEGSDESDEGLPAL